MKVYVLMLGIYSDRIIMSVHATLDSAKAACSGERTWRAVASSRFDRANEWTAEDASVPDEAYDGPDAEEVFRRHEYATITEFDVLDAGDLP